MRPNVGSGRTLRDRIDVVDVLPGEQLHARAADIADLTDEADRQLALDREVPTGRCTGRAGPAADERGVTPYARACGRNGATG